jgi:hypothetical protein
LRIEDLESKIGPFLFSGAKLAHSWLRNRLLRSRLHGWLHS